MSALIPTTSNTEATPTIEVPFKPLDPSDQAEASRVDDPSHQHHSDATLKPAKSPPQSVNSHSSVTDQSDFDQLDTPAAKAEKKKGHRWRLSSSHHKCPDQAKLGSLPSGSELGTNAGAKFSSSSVGSSNRPPTGITDEVQQLSTEPSSTGFPSATQPNNEVGMAKDKDSTPENEKKGPLTWLKAKVQQAKEEHKEREAGKERAKSASRNGGHKEGGPAHLSASNPEGQAARGQSMDTRMGPEEKADKATGLSQPASAASLP